MNKYFVVKIFWG